MGDALQRRKPLTQNKTNTSLKKIESNRRNARHSTGPRTLEGKDRVSHNALKHGLLSSKEVVIPGDEDPAEFDALLEELQRDRQPVGKTEEFLVHEIAAGMWRVRRALRCESGETRKAKDDALHAVVCLSGLSDPIAAAENRRLLHARLQIAEESLAELLDSGDLTIEKRALLLATFPDDGELQRLWREGEMAGNVADKCSAAKTILQTKIKHFNRCLQLAEGYRSLDPEAHSAAASLPSREMLERILGYETRIKRQLYRAMNQLERLQRRRCGEMVPAPIDLDTD
jgi:hypothetical protein